MLQNLRASSFGQRKAIIFFFCDEQDERRHSTRDLLSSLVRQLLVQQPSLFRNVRSLYTLTRDRSNWTRQELRVFFRGILCSRDQVEIVCIIDGLDKCDPLHAQFWEDLVNATTTTGVTGSSLKFIVTTRQRLEVPAESCFSIDLDTQKEVQDDINGLVTAGVAGLVQERPGFVGFEERITTKLLDSPGTTYLTTKLALDELATLKVHSTPSSIRTRLDSLSFGFSESYERQLQSISSDWHSWAYEVLSWVLYTVRPLTIDELAIVLAIKTDSESLSAIEDHISQDMVGDLKQVLGSFISIKNGEVHLVHPTAREFLVSQIGGDSWYIFDPEKVHGHISRTCLTYLSMEEFSDAPSLTESDGNAPLPQPQWGLLTYAAEHWPTHYRRAGDSDPDIHARVLDFLNIQMEVELWPKLYWSIVKLRWIPCWRSAEHIASELGFTEVVMRLLGTTADDTDRGKALESAAGSGHTVLVERLLAASTDARKLAQNSTAFNEAARNGHESVVRLLLESGWKPEPTKEGGPNPLTLAAQNGHTAVVQLLLAPSAGPIPENNKSTALHRAAENGHESVVKVLLDAGVDAEAAYAKSKYLPLHLAAQRGHVAVVKQLLDCGASPEPSSTRLTPLHLAAQGGSLNVVKQLLAAGASVDPSDNTDSTPLHHAAQNGHESVVNLLLESGANPDKIDDRGDTALHLATGNGHVGVVRRLLDSGVDTEVINKNHDTPLHLATDRGHLAASKLLLDSGADTEEVNKNRDTPLHLATRAGHAAVVKLLIDSGAIIEETNTRGDTALHVAAISGHPEVVRHLLEAGANAQAKNQTSETPLHSAVQRGDAEIIGQLLASEVDINAKRADGWTPLHIGVCTDKVEEVKLLLEAGANMGAENARGSTPLFLAAELGNEVITKLLLDKGANPLQTNNNKSTPLHRASQKGHLGVVKLLLGAGASPMAKKDNGLTPLSLAQSTNRTAVVEVLTNHMQRRMLEEGDVNLPDEKGRTKLFYTCAKGLVEATQILLNAKADPTVKDNDGRVPLDLAVKPSVRILLLQHIGGPEGLEIKTLDGAPPCQRILPGDQWVNCDSCRDSITDMAEVFYYRKVLF